MLGMCVQTIIVRANHPAVGIKTIIMQDSHLNSTQYLIAKNVPTKWTADSTGTSANLKRGQEFEPYDAKNHFIIIILIIHNFGWHKL